MTCWAAFCSLIFTQSGAKTHTEENKCYLWLLKALPTSRGYTVCNSLKCYMYLTSSISLYKDWRDFFILFIYLFLQIEEVQGWKKSKASLNITAHTKGWTISCASSAYRNISEFDNLFTILTSTHNSEGNYFGILTQGITIKQPNTVCLLLFQWQYPIFIPQL